jgi:hypothetical protein
LRHVPDGSEADIRTSRAPSPLCPRQRTSASDGPMSASCHEETSGRALQRTGARTPAFRVGHACREPPSSKSEARSKIRSSFSAPPCARLRASPPTRGGCFVSVLGEARRASPAVGAGVDNAELDRKGHKPRRPNRHALTPIDPPSHSEFRSIASVRSSRFLAVHSGKIAFLACSRSI